LYLVGYLLILFTDKVVAANLRPSSKDNKIENEDGVEMAAPDADVAAAGSQSQENIQVVPVDEKPTTNEESAPTP